MPARVKKLEWPMLDSLRDPGVAPRLRRARRIAAQVLAWPLLVKLGLLTGFAIAASVRQLFVVQPWLG